VAEQFEALSDRDGETVPDSGHAQGAKEIELATRALE
jgi:hypothetical protein